MATILDKRTEEEIEEYRNERIEQFLWIVNNIKDVVTSIELTGDPDGLKSMLLDKLQRELNEFMKE